MQPTAVLFAPLLALLLPGCVVRTALDVATAPVRVVGKAADLATTSQSESDEKRGRDLRRREEQLGKLEREYTKQNNKCAAGETQACARRDALGAEIQALLPTSPAAPRVLSLPPAADDR